MPELPEVETIKKQLIDEVVGELIVEIEVREERSFQGDPAALNGATITGINRRGKYLFWYFDTGRGLVSHLKMTGRMIISETDQSELDYTAAKHTRVVIKFGSGKTLFFWDTRKFGYMKIADDIAGEEETAKKTLGPEPWEIDKDYLIGKFNKTERSVKEVILDQTILAGMGNIYANDALWLARINPARKAKELSSGEIDNLLQAMKSVLTKGLETGGASDNTYRDFYGRKGSYQDNYLVYRRTGQPCHTCGSPIKRIVIGGRGTWYCENCQK